MPSAAWPVRAKTQPSMNYPIHVQKVGLPCWISHREKLICSESLLPRSFCMTFRSSKPQNSASISVVACPILRASSIASLTSASAAWG